MGLGQTVQDVIAFMERGGDVLFWIMLTTFVMWALILERFMYMNTTHKKVVAAAEAAWNKRADHRSWYARRIREGMISEVQLQLTQPLILIQTLVAICPLLGLLGTVTGMVEVFDVMAITGSSNPRAMAGGVSKATIPTMAGMIAALSGLYFSFRLKARAEEELHRVSDHLDLR